jgi:hypothetical protein
MPTVPEDLFTLNVIAPHLAGFHPPAGGHNPSGDWELRYRLYTLGAIAGPGGLAGSLLVRRKAKPGGDFVLAVDYRKQVPQQMTAAESGQIACREDALATPRNWAWSSQIVAADGKPVKYTELEKSATAADGAVEISDGPHRRRLSIDSPYAINWALFEAVGRLAREPFEPLRFTLLDHFDQIKRSQTLAFRRTAEVALAERTVRLHAYEHLGEGVVPWIYWVDDAGRLLFAVSGLEAYVLETQAA